MVAIGVITPVELLTIAGLPGSGKSTAGKAVKADLGGSYEYVYIGGIFRKMAADAGAANFEQWYAEAAKDPSIDRKVDEYTASLGSAQGKYVIDSRIGFHMLSGCPRRTFNVFITVEPEEGARRLLNADREKNRYGTLENALKAWHQRIADERERYRSLYGIDHHDRKHFDLVIDSTTLSKDDVVRSILEKLPRT